VYPLTIRPHAVIIPSKPPSAPTIVEDEAELFLS
jgi:hypothetical protein